MFPTDQDETEHENRKEQIHEQLAADVAIDQFHSNKSLARFRRGDKLLSSSRLL